LLWVEMPSWTRRLSMTTPVTIDANVIVALVDARDKWHHDASVCFRKWWGSAAVTREG